MAELTTNLSLIKPSGADNYNIADHNTNMDIIDKIVETGTNTNGTFVKYSNGVMMCFGKLVINRACNIATGALFSSAWTSIPFPANFSTPPSCNVVATAGGYCFFSKSSSGESASSTSGFIISTITREARDYILDYQAFGRWK